MTLRLPTAIRTLCLALPETEEKISHGSPNYQVGGKSFAVFSCNHHGDGMVALHLNTSIETQDMLISSAPDIFFKPAYIGHKGWVGVDLQSPLKWHRVCELTFDAYQRTAPALARSAAVPDAPAPTAPMRPEDIDPLASNANQKLLDKLRHICLALPETTEASQFGHPAFKAGKKTFCLLGHNDSGPYLQFWVGRDAQPGLTDPDITDQRFSIPPYVGHNGWLNLDLSKAQNWQQIEGFIVTSYRHFALQRMIKALDG